VTEQVNEFDQSLKTLEENFDSIKTNKEFKDLQLNLKTIREMMLQANDSNIELHRHMTTIIEHFKILNSPLEQLEKTLPIITELDGRENKKIFISKNCFLSIIQMKQINLN
jgi:predicted  nucleic acid-binding Zn-ribbon protein